MTSMRRKLSVMFRVGRLVYVKFSRNEKVIGFACREAERAALVSAGRDVLPARPGGHALQLGRGLAGPAR
jgi:hypothetical protein